jgi:hypothetical protein
MRKANEGSNGFALNVEFKNGLLVVILECKLSYLIFPNDFNSNASAFILMKHFSTITEKCVVVTKCNLLVMHFISDSTNGINIIRDSVVDGQV